MKSLLPRLQLVELMDLAWFPAWLRRFQTDLLVFAWRSFAPKDEISAQLADLVEASPTRTLVDLCSGSGGFATRLVRAVRERGGGALPLVLTDLYPNPDLPLEEGSSYWPKPVDARAIDPALTGVRTLFGGFHHFPPAEARQILLDAGRSGQPIAVYEMTTRSLLCLFLVIHQALFGSLIFTPFVRPFSWSRLLLTYVLPLVPSTLLVDGIVSVFRSYTPREMLELAGTDPDANYEWRSGTLGSFLVPIVYLTGVPKAPGRCGSSRG